MYHVTLRRFFCTMALSVAAHHAAPGAAAEGDFWQRDDSRGWALFREGKATEAAELLRFAVEQAEELHQPAWELEQSLARLSWVLLDLDRIEEARQAAARGWQVSTKFKTVVRHGPRTQLQLVLAGLNAKDGEHRAALETWAKVADLVEAVPEDRPLGLILHWTAASLESQQQSAQALRLRTQACAILAKLGRKQEAMRAASELAALQFRLGRFLDAVQTYDVVWSKAVDAVKVDDGRAHATYLSQVLLEKSRLHARVGNLELARLDLLRAESASKPFLTNLQTFPYVNFRARLAIQSRAFAEAQQLAQWLSASSSHAQAPADYAELASETEAMLLAARCDHAGAHARWQTVLSARTKRLGADHIDLASTLLGLARADLGLGDWREALVNAERARRLLVSASTTHHPDVAACINVEAQALLAGSAYATAISRCTEAEELHTFNWGDQFHADVAETRVILAEAAWFAGDAALAERQIQTVLSSYPQTTPPLAPLLARAHAIAGTVFVSQGKLKESLASYQQAVQIWDNLRMVPAPDDPIDSDLLHGRALLGLAMVMLAVSPDYEQKAKAAYDDAFKILRRSRDVSEIAYELNRLGNSYWNYGQFREAAWLYKKAADCYTQAFGPSHAFTVRAKTNFQMATEKWNEVSARKLKILQ